MEPEQSCVVNDPSPLHSSIQTKFYYIYFPFQDTETPIETVFPLIIRKNRFGLDWIKLLSLSLSLLYMLHKLVFLDYQIWGKSV